MAMRDRIMDVAEVVMAPCRSAFVDVGGKRLLSNVLFLFVLVKDVMGT